MNGPNVMTDVHVTHEAVRQRGHSMVVRSAAATARLVALASARAAGATRLTHVVAVGNHGRGVRAPCGRDRQVLADHHPGIRVLVPTSSGERSVEIEELLPLRFSVTEEA